MGNLLCAAPHHPGEELDLVGQHDLSDPFEIQMHNTMASLISQSLGCLKAIREYKECTLVLRAAMGAPKDETLQIKAFSNLLPNISLIKSFYDVSVRLTSELPHLFKFLVGKDLREHQVLLKQLADIIDITLSFDYEKIKKPAVQNDFSYYRRYFNKMAPHVEGNIKVHESEAGILSMFIAQNLPLTVTVENVIKGLGEKDGGKGEGSAEGDVVLCNAIHIIGLLANVTCDLALRPGIPEDTRRYALRVMTSAVVLYDRVSATGVFIRRSPVRTRKCLRTLRRVSGSDGISSSLAQQLLNSVKYSTVHYKDGSTPSYIRSLLSD